MGDARSGRVIRFDWAQWLGMIEFDKSGANGNAFLALVQQATVLASAVEAMMWRSLWKTVWIGLLGGRDMKAALEGSWEQELR